MQDFYHQQYVPGVEWSLLWELRAAPRSLPDNRFWGVGFRVQGLAFRYWGSGFRVEGLGVRAQGSGFREPAAAVWVQSGFRGGFELYPQAPS